LTDAMFAPCSAFKNEASYMISLNNHLKH
jgi:hypothetical protein